MKVTEVRLLKNRIFEKEICRYVTNTVKESERYVVSRESYFGLNFASVSTILILIEKLLGKTCRKEVRSQASDVCFACF